MPHQTHYPIFSALGLSEAESKVYEILLENGPKSAAELLPAAGLARGYLYNTLQALKRHRLVTEDDSGAKAVFRAEDPELLRGLGQSNVLAAETVMQQLAAVLPTLASQYRLVTKRATLRSFEGIEGMKQMYREILDAGQPVWAMVGADAAPKELFRWTLAHYTKPRAERGIPVAGILSAAADARRAAELLRNAKKELRTAAVVDAELFPFAGEVNVFGDTVAFMNYKNDALVGFMVESAPLATTLRSVIQLVLTLKGVSVPRPRRPKAPAR